MRNKAIDYMKVNVQILMDDSIDAIYSGIWRSPRMRNRILGKARRYKFTIHLVTLLGEQEVITIEPKAKLDSDELSQVIHKYLNQYIVENQDHYINHDDSYIILRVLSNK